MGKTVNPNWVSGHWRLISARASAFDSASLTFAYNEDTSGDIALDTTFALRISWGESANQTTATNSGTITLQFDVDGGGYANITGTSAVQYVTDASWGTDGNTSSNSRVTLPTGVASFVGAEFDDNNSSTGYAAADQGYEVEYLLTLDSGQLSGGETISFKLQLGGADFDSYDSTPQLTVPAGAQALTPGLFTNKQVFNAPTVTATYDLTPGLFTNKQVFNAPTVTATYDLTPGLFTNLNVFFSPTVQNQNQDLTAGLFTNRQIFYAPAVTATYDVTPALFTNKQVFYAPTATSSYALTPGLFTNTNVFFAPTVTATYDLTPSLFTNTQTFYAPEVSQGGAQTLTPALFTNRQTFYSPTVTGGATARRADGGGIMYVQEGRAEEKKPDLAAKLAAKNAARNQAIIALLMSDPF